MQFPVLKQGPGSHTQVGTGGTASRQPGRASPASQLGAAVQQTEFTRASWEPHASFKHWLVQRVKVGMSYYNLLTSPNLVIKNSSLQPVPNGLGKASVSKGAGAPITNLLLPKAAIFLAQLRRPEPVLDPCTPEVLRSSCPNQGWGESCVVPAQKKGQLCLAWASSEKGCLLFLESCKIPRQSHKEKEIFLRAKKESQTRRTVEGLAHGHTARHCWSWTET